ncbi:MAG: hypothetical protein NVSMB63_12220 [Sediminibacterium sp.]
MKDMNRDLLLLSRYTNLSQDELEREVEKLHSLLYHAESWESFCIAHEIIHVSRHKIIQKPELIQRTALRKADKPFVFLHNKN